MADKPKTNPDDWFHEGMERVEPGEDYDVFFIMVDNSDPENWKQEIVYYRYIENHE